MAFTYKNAPVLSKLKIGDSIYFLKDAELRAIVDAFGDAVSYSVDKTFNPASENLATSAAIANHIQTAVAGLAGAMHFIGVKDALPATGVNGDVVIIGTAEYVYFEDGNEETSNWHLVGDEGVYATIAGVEAEYVKKTLTIAGIDLKDAITADELKAALGLGALAYKNNASGSITTIDEVKIADHTPAGNVSVTVEHTSTAMTSSGTYTPAGSVSGTTTAAGSVTLERNENGIQVTGTVSAPTITVTPNTAEVQHIDSLGQLPSYTAAQYVAPSVNESKSAFASEGIVAAVDAEDAEMLVFSAAAKSDAIVGTGFNAGSYTAAEFNAGALPTLGTAQTVVTGIASATASAPAFTGDKFGATFAGQEAAITASFAGQEGAVNVSGNYDKATSAPATFEGAAASVTVELVKSAKTITVE